MDPQQLTGRLVMLIDGGAPTERQRMDALNAGVIELRRRGHSVSPAEGVPGLWDVSGMGELTINQVRSFDPRLSEL